MRQGDDVMIEMHGTVVYVSVDSEGRFCVGNGLAPEDVNERIYSRHSSLAAAMLQAAYAVGAQ